MLNRNISILCLYLIMFGLVNLSAQSRKYEVFQLHFLYDEIKFSEVIDQGNALLLNREILGKQDLVEIHKYMALSFFNLAQMDSSRAQFYALLSLIPNYKPDPIRTSPKIIQFFKKIKKDYTRISSKEKRLSFRQYIFVEDIRPQAALRSLTLPGWGQFYKKDRSKGYILGGAFWGSAAITAITYSLERHLRSKYLSETDVANISKRYDDYNTMSKTRRFMQYTALTTWAIAIADALFSEYNPPLEISPTKKGLTLSIAF